MRSLQRLQRYSRTIWILRLLRLEEQRSVAETDLCWIARQVKRWAIEPGGYGKVGRFRVRLMLPRYDDPNAKKNSNETGTPSGIRTTHLS